MKRLLFILCLVPTMAFAKFSSQDSAGANLIGGNSNLKTYNLQSTNKWDYDKNFFVLTAIYNYGETNDVRSAENWNTGLRYSREIRKKVGIVGGFLLESDRFAGVSKRYNTDLGAKYTFSKSDDFNLFAELGYRYTVEKSTSSTVADRKDSKARLYAETTKTVKKDLEVQLWIEYLPNFTESEDWQLNIEPSMTMTLTSLFSLKSSYLWKMDNLPNGDNSKYDYNYFLSLIAKF